MAATQVRPYDLVSRDAQTALTEFVEDFALALAQEPVEQWAKTLGTARSTKALVTKFPIPVSAAGYAEFVGNLRYRSIFTRTITLTPKTWQDGVAELARIVEAPDFIGWAEEPARMAAAALSLPNEIIAALLEAGTSGTHELDGVAFFSDAHPYNVFDADIGTFDNNHTGAGSALSSSSLLSAKERMRKIKAPNGKPMGLRLTHIIVPPALEETAKQLLEQDMMIQAVGSSFGAVDNIHKGTVKMTVADELTSDAVWYALALNKPGVKPWVIQDGGAPETRNLDKSSALYEKELKVGVDSILDANGGLLFPHCLHRYAGA
jgi:phage major head subunit gpT-like protein